MTEVLYAVIALLVGVSVFLKVWLFLDWVTGRIERGWDRVDSE